MFKMWDVGDVGRSGCGILVIWDVWDVGCRIFTRMWDVNLRCQSK